MLYTKTPIAIDGVWRDGLIVESDIIRSFSNEIALPTGERYLVELFPNNPHRQYNDKHYYWFLIVRELEANEQIKYLEAQIKALADRGEFIEDCIAEMAMTVYA